MKKSIISMAFIAFVFAGCNTNNKNEHQHNTDGSHIHSEKEHHQEEFKVPPDSIIINQDNKLGHSHEDRNHQH
jgi:uncharacterized lipoprotein